MTIKQAQELLKKPVFGSDECIYAVKVLKLAEEMKSAKTYTGKKRTRLLERVDQMTDMQLKAELKDLYGTD